MKKFFNRAALLLFIILILALAGCAGSSAKNSNSQAGTFPEDPERPDRVAEIYGKVKSIEGNKVVLAEMERLNDPAELSDEDKAKRREQMQGLSEEERRKLRDTNEKPTGKTLGATIPVGIPVKVKEAGPDGKIKEGSLSDLKSGVMVSIWLDSNASDKKTAEYVNISLRQ